jgi:hypothetical protein
MPQPRHSKAIIESSSRTMGRIHSRFFVLNANVMGILFTNDGLLGQEPEY